MARTVKTVSKEPKPAKRVRVTEKVDVVEPSTVPPEIVDTEVVEQTVITDAQPDVDDPTVVAVDVVEAVVGNEDVASHPDPMSAKDRRANKLKRNPVVVDENQHVHDPDEEVPCLACGERARPHFGQNP